MKIGEPVYVIVDKSTLEVLRGSDGETFCKRRPNKHDFRRVQFRERMNNPHSARVARVKLVEVKEDEK